MRILDRYVIRSFLTSALLWFGVFMAMRIVTDLFINMDEFIKAKESVDESFGSIVANILSYYGHQSLVYFMDLGGVMIVAAAAFTLAWMNHTNELTAMLASGVSLYRVVWPIILCSVALSGLIILDQEVLIPRVCEKLVRHRDDAPGTEIFNIRLMTDGDRSVWYSPRFMPANNEMARPLIVIRNADYVLLAKISGAKAVPVPVGIDGRKGWIITDGVISRAGQTWRYAPDVRKIRTRDASPAGILRQLTDKSQPIANPNRLPLWVDDLAGVEDPQYNMVIRADRFKPTRAAAGGPVGGTLRKPRFYFSDPVTGQSLGAIVARSARWVGEADDEGYWELTEGAVFYPSDLTATNLVLRKSSRWMEFMSTSQLTRLIKLKRVPDRDGALLAKYVRIISPINNVVMLLLGLPFILSRERNVKASATLCLLMVGTFYAFIYICRNFGLSPMLAAWLPVLLFGPVAAVMLDSVKT